MLTWLYSTSHMSKNRQIFFPVTTAYDRPVTTDQHYAVFVLNIGAFLQIALACLMIKDINLRFVCFSKDINLY
jgi:hypothetical protein